MLWVRHDVPKIADFEAKQSSQVFHLLTSEKS